MSQLYSMQRMGYCCSHLWQINKWKNYLMIFFFFLCRLKPLTLAITIAPLRKKLTLEPGSFWREIINSFSHITVQKMTQCTLNHWWFLKVKQGRWCWLADAYAWCTKGVPTVPTLICRKKMTSRRNGRMYAKGEAICFTFRRAGGPGNWTVLQMINFISCSVGWWVDLTLFLNHSMAIF